MMMEKFPFRIILLTFIQDYYDKVLGLKDHSYEGFKQLA